MTSTCASATTASEGPFVDGDLARQVEAANAARSVQYAQAKRGLPGGENSTAEPIADGYAIYAGRGAPMNRVAGLGMRQPVTGMALDQVESFYRSRGASPRVDVCPLADRSLLELLRERTYRLEGFYSILIRRIRPGVEAPRTEQLDVRQVSASDVALWIRTVAAGFSEQDPPPAEVIQLIAPTVHSAQATCFLAWLAGEPAGGGASVFHAGVVELGSDSTRTAFRRRGVQTALVHARLAAAAAAGCDLAIAVTSPGSASQRNIERAGFRLAYTKAITVGT